MSFIFKELYIKDNLILFWTYVAILVISIIITAILVNKELRNNK